MIELSKDFAVDVINTIKLVKERSHESVMTNQLLRSATSIGANLHESKYGHSTADFIAKMKIALKECYESEYWLELIVRTDYISQEEYCPLRNLAGSLRSILIASINTAQRNSGSNT